MAHYYVGLMSGTSIDSIDAALIKLDNCETSLCHAITFPIPPELRTQLLSLCHDVEASIDQIGASDRRIAELFAGATLALCNQAGVARTSIRAIGSHGQTIRHRPSQEFGGPFTWQIGDANIIAAKTGIDTVADFRRMDMAVGGQAAPLAPLFHQALFGSDTIIRTIINIGGISNATYLNPATGITGFDLGPGNSLMDTWILRHLSKPFDGNGDWAATGQVHPQLLNELLTHPFFAKLPPKSTGREDFHIDWLDQNIAALASPPSSADVQATLLELTAQSIVNGIGDDYKGNEIYICGGGAFNKALMARLQQLFAPTPVADTCILGIAPEWVEAAGFALLAHRRLEKIPSNCPSITGSSRATILGGLYCA